jgi:hypothetical protein
MDIHICVRNYSKHNRYDSFSINKLVENLRNKYGFYPQIFDSLNEIDDRAYYIVFRDSDFYINPIFSKNMIIIGASRDEIGYYLEIGNFAAFVVNKSYISNYPTIYGLQDIADKLAIKKTRTFDMGYSLIYEKDSTNIDLLVKYLIEYDKMLHEK